MSSPRYIPLHKRSHSASSTISTSPVTTYSRDELFALMPGASSHHHSPSSSPSEPHYIHQHQASEGWVALNSAIKTYLRSACPEIVLNRKMRKALEYHSFQAKRSQSPPRTHTNTHQARPASPASSSTSAHEEEPVEVAAPTSRPSTPWKRVGPRSGARRRPAPRANRHNSFMLFHKQIAAGAATEEQWRHAPVSPAVIASH